MRKMSDVVEVAENKLDLPVQKFSFIAKQTAHVLEFVSSTSFGQCTIRYVDKFLWTVENTAKWSLPQTSITDSNKKILQPPPLIRPLPWLLFLPALVILRFIRIGLSLLFLVCGQSPVTPTSMVHFIQTTRRRVKAIKYIGLSVMRIRHAKKQAITTLWSAFKNVVCVFLCLPRLEENNSIKVTVGNKIKLKTESHKRHADELLGKFAKLGSSEHRNFEANGPSNSEELSMEDSEVKHLLNKTQTSKEFEEILKKVNEKPKKLLTSAVQQIHGMVTSSPLNTKGDVKSDKNTSRTQNIDRPSNFENALAENGVENEERPVQTSNIAIVLKRLKNEPISQPNYGSSVEDTFYSPIASPTSEIIVPSKDVDNRPDMIDGHKLRGKHGEEHSNFVAITPTLEFPTKSSPSPTVTSSTKLHQPQYKQRSHHKRRSNKHKKL